MAFQISTTHEFAAAHQLRLYDGTLEPLHGHNWKLRATVESDKLDAMGVVMDFHELARLVDEVTVGMHNRHLNDLPQFADVSPSAENLAAHVARSVSAKLPAGVRLLSVEVWETAGCRAVFVPPEEFN